MIQRPPPQRPRHPNDGENDNFVSRAPRRFQALRRLPHEELLSLAAGKSSAPIPTGVCAARSIQQARFGPAASNRSRAAKTGVYTNAGAPPRSGGPGRGRSGGTDRGRGDHRPEAVAASVSVRRRNAPIA
jgi:hypothetical protein